ncbi:hypothetical protein Ddc_09753 [Ditylenchus destructor]|nr:hypothetical protein Ddc_09753 [Ditylenchus destructor]
MQSPIIFITFLVFAMLNASGRDDDPFSSYCYKEGKGIKEKIVKCEKEFPYQSGNMTDACRNGNKIVNCFYDTVANCSEKVALQILIVSENGESLGKPNFSSGAATENFSSGAATGLTYYKDLKSDLFATVRNSIVKAIHDFVAIPKRNIA